MALRMTASSLKVTVGLSCGPPGTWRPRHSHLLRWARQGACLLECGVGERLGHAARELLHCSLIRRQQGAEELRAHAAEEAICFLNVRQHVHEAGRHGGHCQCVRYLPLCEQRPCNMAEDVREGRHVQLAEQLGCQAHELGGIRLAPTLLGQGGGVVQEVLDSLWHAQLHRELEQQLLPTFRVQSAVLPDEGAHVLEELGDGAGERQVPAGLRQEAEHLRSAHRTFALQSGPKVLDELRDGRQPAELVIDLRQESVEVPKHRRHFLLVVLGGVADDPGDVLEGL
mmetsp:Transcript_77966/g.215566  ORF Transcript_77966/g.215566 Transcript_77966/m.215566 type:complete len:284 (+) Transcript_77966:1-852(+)